ncbi:glutathione peroxidase [Bhargavaea beijingensis]|uniref:Glutathione peroxidase n=1 Tax=Bhargavaea beijingensis TaxID=426756 RepID=A0A1G7GTZ4_9BACL|nr:glutathione peroxidase [Bhargavaea beijingensis]MCW1929606.1 glutathione peroxidase [Bhargavaea beijingensis]RSK31655.1 glutathione peroxidase [Bhargavaea beijingensis]SDE91616.1 glutathione peroxidase [Bhargavaea beijingensis]
MAATIYDFEVEKTDGTKQALSDYEGQVVLIVNTASKCGFANQFDGLQALYEEFQDQGFAILGFPSDQFMNQEFEDIEETMEFCRRNYGVSFPMYAKVDVKGNKADALFKYLTSETKGLLGGDIKWNFTKFLIGRDGRPAERYAPQTKPEKIRDDIKKQLIE